MAVYNTKQRQSLLEFLSTHTHETFSVTQVINYFADKQISTSAVYRNLAELEQLGTIRRVGKENSREAHYQYVNSDSCGGKVHLHCQKCNKLVHLSDSVAEQLTEKLSADGFAIDCTNTVINGLCSSCQKG